MSSGSGRSLHSLRSTTHTSNFDVPLNTNAKWQSTCRNMCGNNFFDRRAILYEHKAFACMYLLQKSDMPTRGSEKSFRFHIQRCLMYDLCSLPMAITITSAVHLGKHSPHVSHSDFSISMILFHRHPHSEPWIAVPSALGCWETTSCQQNSRLHCLRSKIKRESQHPPPKISTFAKLLGTLLSYYYWHNSRK